MRTILVLVLVAVACKSKPDCGAYAEQLARISLQGFVGDREARRYSLEQSARQSCEDGRIDGQQVSCVIAANTMNELLACQGLQPLPTTTTTTTKAPPPPQAPERVRRTGFSVAVPAGWKALPKKYDDEVMLNGPAVVDSVRIAHGSKVASGLADDAACREVADAFIAKTHTTLRSSGLAKTQFGPACRYVFNDDKLAVVVTRMSANGTLEMLCSFPLASTEPPRTCDEILAGIATE